MTNSTLIIGIIIGFTYLFYLCLMRSWFELFKSVGGIVTLFSAVRFTVVLLLLKISLEAIQKLNILPDECGPSIDCSVCDSTAWTDGSMPSSSTRTVFWAVHAWVAGLHNDSKVRSATLRFEVTSRFLKKVFFFAILVCRLQRETRFMSGWWRVLLKRTTTTNGR